MKKKNVSYSQYAQYFNCPHMWMLNYIKGLKKFEASIHMTFGNAMHEAIQKYVETLYTQGMIKATTVNMREIFIDAFVDEIFTNKLNCTESEIQEFIEDGVNIIKEFMTAACRLEHFPLGRRGHAGRGLRRRLHGWKSLEKGLGHAAPPAGHVRITLA